jgi:WhiB family redox-sensing transcriptional regulator
MAETLVKVVDKDWREKAACRGLTAPDYIWFPPRGRYVSTRAGAISPTQRLLDLCEGCPVRITCLDFAIAGNEPGIWGGTSFRQRRAIKKERVSK